MSSRLWQMAIPFFYFFLFAKRKWVCALAKPWQILANLRKKTEENFSSPHLPRIRRFKEQKKNGEKNLFFALIFVRSGARKYKSKGKEKGGKLEWVRKYFSRPKSRDFSAGEYNRFLRFESPRNSKKFFNAFSSPVRRQPLNSSILISSFQVSSGSPFISQQAVN